MERKKALVSDEITNYFVFTNSTCVAQLPSAAQVHQYHINKTPTILRHRGEAKANMASNHVKPWFCFIQSSRFKIHGSGPSMACSPSTVWKKEHVIHEWEISAVRTACGLRQYFDDDVRFSVPWNLFHFFFPFSKGMSRFHSATNLKQHFTAFDIWSWSTVYSMHHCFSILSLLRKKESRQLGSIYLVTNNVIHFVLCEP